MDRFEPVEFVFEGTARERPLANSECDSALPAPVQ